MRIFPETIVSSKILGDTVGVNKTRGSSRFFPNIFGIPKDTRDQIDTVSKWSSKWAASKYFLMCCHTLVFLFLLPLNVRWYFYKYWALMVSSFTTVCLLIFLFFLPAHFWPLIKLSGHIKASRQKVLPPGLRALKWVYLEVPRSKNIRTYLVKWKF